MTRSNSNNKQGVYTPRCNTDKRQLHQHDTQKLAVVFILFGIIQFLLPPSKHLNSSSIRIYRPARSRHGFTHRVHCTQQRGDDASTPSNPSKDPDFLAAVKKVNSAFRKTHFVEDLEHKKSRENEKRRRMMNEKKSFAAIERKKFGDRETALDKDPNQKPHIPHLIVVEGEKDKQALLRIVDAKVVQLGGDIMSSKMTTFLEIRKKGGEGILVLTGPGRAGRKARDILNDEFGPCYHAFLPAWYARSSRTGEVGVEFASEKTILSALQNARMSRDSEGNFAWEHLEEMGLVQGNGGHSGAGLLRQLVCDALGIGPCDGKQLTRALNKYNFNIVELAGAQAVVNEIISTEGPENAKQLSLDNADLPVFEMKTFNFTVVVNSKPFGMVMNTGSASVKSISGPAEAAGLRVGDEIIEIIDGETRVPAKDLKQFLETFKVAEPPFKILFSRRRD
eukprot:CAMPEP_0114516544 /NCGR_PEP_ID=MMETSP0109-20121206/17388_1 /TAXON_ID=29199 /ORGANISM="Chlorarachnion reptans, Strain CCCM449" /LENGTH=449 /DNA_ID=CAMNT_0001696947 /DNA_START=283 /DNA_END=1633 /DNA_ORIENTATION=-